MHLYEPTVTCCLDEVNPKLGFGVFCWRWHWLVCLFLVHDMVLILGVEYSEVGPRTI
jgi:hypothetical protein